MVDPTGVVIDQLVNLGTRTLTELLNSKPTIEFAAISPMTAIPSGTTPDQLTGWRHKSINIPWHTVWGVGEAWGSNCQMRLRYSYGGQFNGVGQYLANMFLTRGNPWDPSVESVMKVTINPGSPENVGTAEQPMAAMPITVSMHEHMEPWFLTGSEEHDWTFYLYGNGSWQHV